MVARIHLKHKRHYIWPESCLEARFLVHDALNPGTYYSTIGALWMDLKWVISYFSSIVQRLSSLRSFKGLEVRVT